MRTDICRHRHKGAAASREAFAKVDANRGRLRARILAYLRKCPSGLTVEGIAHRLSLRYTTVSARVAELKREGLVKDSGGCRKTTSGCDAAVVVAV